MLHAISEKGQLLFTANITWNVQTGKDVNEAIQLNVNEILVSLTIALEWIPKTTNPICKLCLRETRDSPVNAGTSSSEHFASGLKLCTMWVHVNNSEKRYLSKQPSLEVWMSDLLDSSIHGILQNDNSLKEINLVLWIQLEPCNDRLAMLQFQRLLKEQIHCDIYFRFRDGVIGSHVAVLVARSPVFAAMFKHDTREKQSREVEIQEIEKEVFFEFLNFLYSGQLSNNLSSSSAESLYEAADKYCVDSLKVVCVHLLSTQLEISNVISILVWSHFHSELSLKKQAIDFMSLHSEDVSKRSEWEDMIRNHFDALL